MGGISLSKAQMDFELIDTNDDGKVSKEEFKAVLTASGNFNTEQIDLITEDWIDERPRAAKMFSWGQTIDNAWGNNFHNTSNNRATGVSTTNSGSSWGTSKTTTMYNRR